MTDYIKRVFIKLFIIVPLAIILTLSVLTVIIPVLVWILFDVDYISWCIDFASNIYWKLL